MNCHRPCRRSGIFLLFLLAAHGPRTSVTGWRGIGAAEARQFTRPSANTVTGSPHYGRKSVCRLLRRAARSTPLHPDPPNAQPTTKKSPEISDRISWFGSCMSESPHDRDGLPRSGKRSSTADAERCRHLGRERRSTDIQVESKQRVGPGGMGIARFDEPRSRPALFLRQIAAMTSPGIGFPSAFA